MNSLRHLSKKAQSLSERPGFRKYFFNTGWLFGEKILRMIAGVLVGAYVARHLGPANFGLLNYAASLVALFSPLAWLGMESIVTKVLIEDDSIQNKVLGTAFFLKLAASAILFLLIVLVVENSDTDQETRLLIYIIAVGVFLETFNVIQFLFQAKALSKYMVWSQMTSLLIVSGLRIIWVITNAPLVWFAATFTIDLMIITLGLVLFYSKKYHTITRWRFERHLAKSLMKQSWPLIIGSISVTLYMKVDQLMIKWMLGNEANGNYSVAVRLSELWYFIPLAISASLFPALLNAKSISHELYVNRLQKLYDLMVILSVSIAIPMTFLSSTIITILFGESYSEAAPILSLYIWSAVFVFLGVANSRAIVSEGLQKLRMINLMVAALVNIVLNYYLIQYIGLTGAAISTLISYSIASYFGLLFNRKTLPIFASCSKSLNIFGLIFRLIKELKKKSSKEM